MDRASGPAEARAKILLGFGGCVKSSVEDLPPRVARAMLWTALALLFCIRAFDAARGGMGAEALFLAGAPYPPLVALLAGRFRLGVRLGLLVALAALALMPFAVVGMEWGWLPWTVGAGVLVALPARASWPLLGAVVAATAVTGLLAGEPVNVWAWRPLALATDALIVFSLHSLSGLVADLHATRDELARIETSRERLRLDAELRRTVGTGLRSITERLAAAAEARPEDARVWIQEATETARRTLAEVRSMAGGYRAASGQDMRPPVGSPRFVRVVLAAVVLIQAVRPVMNVFTVAGDPRWLYLLVPLLAVAVALLLSRPSRGRLVALGLLLVPVAWPGSYAAGTLLVVSCMWGLFAGAALTWVRPPRSWAIAAAVLALQVVVCITPPPVASPADMVTSVLSPIILAWLFYGLSRLGGLVVLLGRARQELAVAAVAAERLRIGRDLHDVLGFSLSAVALRGELALRLLDRDPVRAATELAALVPVLERAHAELGAITGGRVRLELRHEIDAAVEALEAAGIAVHTDVEIGTLPDETGTALAAVLREGVTNVLRHSRARTCAITVTGSGGAAWLRIVNDGAGEPRAPVTGGVGLESLAARAGGRLSAGPRRGGGFEVVAEFRSDPAGLGGDADGVDPVAGAELADR
ncbi:sensor histidine kinase [Actinomadura nitritigenes]|uniref:sensor histidine kinase n=1 Tax=Actinomadura nitritigenes TaxID=134602 RepID=UPI003D8AE252